jgi:hypothetical protein
MDAARQIDSIAGYLESGRILTVNHCGGPSTTVKAALEECTRAWQVGLGVLIGRQDDNVRQLHATAAVYRDADDKLAASVRKALESFPGTVR